MNIITVSSLLSPVVWTLLSGIAYTAGDILLRIWFEEKFTLGFPFVFVIYMTGTFCMMMSFFGQNIAIATVAAIVVNVTLYVIAAYLLYGDPIHAWQVIGLVLGLVSLAILELS